MEFPTEDLIDSLSAQNNSFFVSPTYKKIQSILRSEGQGSSNIIDQLQNNLNDRDKIIKMLFEQVFFLENEVSSLNISFEDEISNLNFKIQLKNNRIDELTKRVNLNINIIQSMIDYVYENYSDVNIADLVEICNIERIEDNLLIPKDLATRESKDIAVVKNGDTERLILKIMEEETVSKDRELTSEIIEVLTNYKEIKNKLVYATTEYNKNIYLLKSIVCNDISVENDDILSLYTYSKFEDLINQVELKFKNITSNYEALQEEIIVLKEKNIVRQDLEDVIDKEENSIYVKGKYGETPESKSNGRDVNFEIKNYSNRLEEIMKELKIYHEDGAIRNLVSNISVLRINQSYDLESKLIFSDDFEVLFKLLSNYSNPDFKNEFIFYSSQLMEIFYFMKNSFDSYTNDIKTLSYKIKKSSEINF